ncbi:hypothetical protein [Actinacidiphila sp. bgisy160]|uniref:hypothetical protein n=1 Tax=Actinacidiphila sp. bgisy160 TaxID=3413796 RepID=UPI003D708959
MTIEQFATLAMFSSTWAVLAVGHTVACHVFGLLCTLEVSGSPGVPGWPMLRIRSWPWLAVQARR